MPVLPTLESSQSVFSNVQLKPQEIQANPAAFGAATGEALQGLGQSGEKAGTDVFQAAISQRDLNDEAKVNQTFSTGLAPTVRALSQQMYTLKGQAAVDAQPELSQAMESAREAYRNQLTPLQQRAYDQVSARLLMNEQNGMSRFVAQQQTVANKQASDNLVYSFKQNAADKYNDPINFGGMLNSVAAERNEQAKLENQPPEQIANQIQADKSQMWVDRLRMIATKDPAAAYSMLQNGEDYTANGQAQHTDVMSQIVPTERAHLIDELRKGSDVVSAHSTAAAFLTGTPPPDASTFNGVIKSMESGGDKNAVGPYILGQGTAKGDQQVMDATNVNPGYGVTPAKDNSPEERSRVGADYANAMLQHYGDPAKAFAAYNAGPGRVDAAIAKANASGNPGAWLQNLPPETQAYVTKGTATLTANAPAPSATPFAPATPPAQGAVTGTLPVPTANAGPAANNPVTGLDPVKMEADLAQRVAVAQQWAQNTNPGNPAYADQVAREVESQGKLQINAARTTQAAAAETITNAIDGGKVTSMNDLMADQGLKASYNQLSQKSQIAVQDMFAAGTVKLDNNNLPLYAKLKGEQVENPSQFAKEDIVGTYGGKLPTSVLKEMINEQAAIIKGDQAQANKAVSLTGAWGNVSDIATNAGITESKDPANTTKLKGAYLLALENYQREAGKPADTQTQRKLMSALLVQGTQTTPGVVFGNAWPNHPSTMAFQSPDLKSFNPPQNDQGWALHIDKHGNQAYVSPDGTQFKAVQ